jgi:hypothetical protein
MNYLKMLTHFDKILQILSLEFGENLAYREVVLKNSFVSTLISIFYVTFRSHIMDCSVWLVDTRGAGDRAPARHQLRHRQRRPGASTSS